MSNLIQVIGPCTVSPYGYAPHTYSGGETVSPGSPYYYPLLWSGLATDTGTPAPTGPVTYPLQTLQYDPGTNPTPANNTTPKFDATSQTWKLVAFPTGVTSDEIDFVALARNPDLLVNGAITRDSNGAAISAPVMWPDGTVGTYTADVVSTAFPGSVDAYHITYGSPVTKTFTQNAVTRDSSTGAVTNVPAIVVT